MGKKLRAELILKDIIEELRSFRTAIIIFLTNIVLLVCVASIFYSVINSKQNGYATNYKAVLYMYNKLIIIWFNIFWKNMLYNRFKTNLKVSLVSQSRISSFIQKKSI